MARKYRTLEEVASRWNLPPNSPSPVFPVLHFEIIKAEECRGFLELENCIGDIDFVGYRLDDCEILVDSLGRVYNMMFDEFVIPNLIIANWSESELKDNIIPALKYAGNEQLTNEVMNEKNVTAIVHKMATYFAW